MKIKRLLSCITVAALMLTVLPCINVAAATAEIFNDTLSNEYALGKLHTMWWGKHDTQNKNYANGITWSSPYGRMLKEWLK